MFLDIDPGAVDIDGCPGGDRFFMHVMIFSSFDLLPSQIYHFIAKTQST